MIRRLLVLALALAIGAPAAAQVVTGASTGTASLPPPYLGQVATRSFVPLAMIPSGSATWVMARTTHTAMDQIVNPTVCYGNYYISTGNVETTTGVGTIKASLEYPAGTFALAQENASGAVAFPLGNTCLHYAVTIPKGSIFYDRVLETNASGPVFRGGQANQFMTSDGFQFGTGTPTDLVTSGTVSDSSGSHSQGYPPVAVLSMTQKASFAIVGDSQQAASSADVVSDVTGNIGQFPRVIGQAYGYINLGVGSSLLATFNSQSKTYRNQLIGWTNNLLNAYCVNDFQSGGDSAATCAARRATLAAAYPNSRVIGATLVPNTTTIDAWATLANQTISAVGTIIQTFNGLVRTGITGERAVLDSASWVDPYLTGKWVVGYDPATAVGTANFATPDGLHSNQIMNQTMRDVGAGRMVAVAQ